jgi:hypothetical protein
MGFTVASTQKFFGKNSLRSCQKLGQIRLCVHLSLSKLIRRDVLPLKLLAWVSQWRAHKNFLAKTGKNEKFFFL